MSELFEVRVRSVKGPKAVLEVTSVHPDSGPVAPSATFAMMLLFEGASRASRSPPLTQLVDAKRVYDSKWVRANARAFVERAELSGKLLTVHATDPAWTSHLKAGVAWASAAWDEGPGKPAPAAKLPVPSKGASKAPNEGFEKAKFPKVPTGCVKQGLVPTLPVGRYEADPVLRDGARIVAALKTLVGAPVLVRLKRRAPELIVPVQKPRSTTSQVVSKKKPKGNPPGLFYSEHVRAYAWNVKRIVFVCVRPRSLNGFDTIDCGDVEWLGRATLR